MSGTKHDGGDKKQEALNHGTAHNKPLDQAS
jgi:hypothetical protein